LCPNMSKTPVNNPLLWTGSVKKRFIALIQREKFDYTQWRQTLFADLSGEEISRQAMEFQGRKPASATTDEEKTA
jgi:hypothetical protein